MRRLASYTIATSIAIGFLSVAHAQVAPLKTLDANAADSFAPAVIRAMDSSTPTARTVTNVERLDLSGLRSAGGSGSCDGCGCCKSCTCKETKAAAAKAAGAYKGVFYLNDFSYLSDPCYRDCLLGDGLKQIPFGRCGKLDFGGQYRARYHHETGMKGTHFQATTDDFLLNRVRLFANYQVNSMLRFYVETLYADSMFEGNGTRGIDENSMDFQNFLVDLKLTEGLTARLGRQELQYGGQRTVSPLDWSNTRRTFEGIRLLYRSGDWAVDGFFTHFVPVLPTRMDNADYQQPFYGMYGVYSGWENSTLDFYYLGYDNSGTGLSLHTLGARLNGSCPCSDWLYEIEGATQFGSRATNVDQDGEGFVTLGLGRKFSSTPWTPTLWFYYDYASENYNHLFPLAHKYLGFIDAVQRTNVETPNLLLTMKPSKKTNLLFWFYHFQSNTAAPVPSVGGTPAQNASKHFGNELDMIFKYTINPRSDVLFGYSHFWRGSKITETQDADFIYTQYQLNF